MANFKRKIRASSKSILGVIYCAFLLAPILFAAYFEEKLRPTFASRFWVLLAICELVSGIYGFLVIRWIWQWLQQPTFKQRVLLQASSGMTLLKHLDHLLKLNVHLVTRFGQVTHATIFLLHKAPAYVLSAYRYQSLKGSVDRLERNHPLIASLEKQPYQPIILDRIRSEYEKPRYKNQSGYEDAVTTIISTMRTLNAEAIIPIVLFGSPPAGFLVMGARKNGEPFDVSDLDIFKLWARRMAEAIENANFFKEFSTHFSGLAETDALTGLWNRRKFNEEISIRLMAAERTHETIGLAILDLDDFKKYNDTFGHPAGDELLETVAGSLKRHVRPQDAVFRLGGEEFAIIFKNVSEEEAKDLCEQMRLAVSTCTAGTNLSGITVSVGLAVFPEHASDGTDLYQVADVALYRAKQSGKDCSCVAKPRIQNVPV